MRLSTPNMSDGDYVLRIHPMDDNLRGYCECCGTWVRQNDSEISACPMRWLSEHGMEWRCKCREEIRKNRPRTEAELRAIHTRLRSQP